MLGRVGICGVLIATLMVAGFAGGALADPKGVWLSGSGKSHVKIHPCDDDNEKLCGEIVWLRSPLGKDGKPRRDIHNDNKSLRERPIMGLRVLWDLEDDGRGEWDDGEIYNPEDGETYDAEMEEVDANTLKVRGCVWFPLQDPDLGAGGIIGRRRPVILLHIPQAPGARSARLATRHSARGAVAPSGPDGPALPMSDTALVAACSLSPARRAPSASARAPCRDRRSRRPRHTSNPPSPPPAGR